LDDPAAGAVESALADLECAHHVALQANTSRCVVAG
jgi:hypothetical protein